MNEVAPNRMNLLVREAQVRLARQGADLLKRRRFALMREFQSLARQFQDGRRKLGAQAAAACRELFVAQAIDGGERVRSAGLAVPARFTVNVGTRNLWGVKVPELGWREAGADPLDRGYALSGVSMRIDETAEQFELLTRLLLDLAPLEIKLKRLGREIRRTTRRVNALEERLIPRLRAEAEQIRRVLEEREREDILRLKRIKAKRAKSGAAL